MCITNTVLAFLMVCGCALQTSNLHVEVSQRVIHIHVNETARVRCRATEDYRPVPLKTCQFYHPRIGVLDMSAGHATPPHHLYNFSGRGLMNGDCGIELGGYHENNAFEQYGCRVRAAGGGPWQYAAFSVNVDMFGHNMDYTLTPNEATADVGSDISIKGVADRSFLRCQFFLPTDGYVYFEETSPTLSHHKNIGGEYEDKTCVITLRNVSDDWNGFISSWVQEDARTNAQYRRDTMSLIVRSAPDPPRLSLNHIPAMYKVGDILQATCVVANSRPVSTMTWLLDDDVIRDDNIDESPIEDKWRWNHDLQTVTQHLNRTLEQEDDGKTLFCRAEHQALPGGVYSTSICINFERPSATGFTAVNWIAKWWIWLLGIILVIMLLLSVVLAIRYVGKRGQSVHPVTSSLDPVPATDGNEGMDGYLAPIRNHRSQRSTEPLELNMVPHDYMSIIFDLTVVNKGASSFMEQNSLPTMKVKLEEPVYDDTGVEPIVSSEPREETHTTMDANALNGASRQE